MMGADPWYRDGRPEWVQKQANQAGRLEVCRGRIYGDWITRAYVPSTEVAEAVLARWRREHPGQIVALLRGGERAEDEERKVKRLRRERTLREAAHFLSLADEARRQGRHAEAR